VLRSSCVAFLLLVACDSGTGGDASPQGHSAPSAAVTAQRPADPLQGEWHQTFTCEESVRTFQRNVSELQPDQREVLAELKGSNDTSVPTLLKEYTREFAWGPNAKGPIHGALTSAQIRPGVICEGSPGRDRDIRFLQGFLVVREEDNSTEGPAAYEFVDDHTITVNDGGVNFGDPATPIDTFSFRIEGDTLTFSMTGQDDPWAGLFEVAPWHRTR
jgi:hypothetical protein